jgi:purine-binding chemotaxis protein CheW
MPPGPARLEGESIMDGGSFNPRPSAAPASQPMDHVLVTLQLGAQLCGVDVGVVREVLHDPVVTPVPLAPPEIAGCLNLRGRVVTALDMRRRLGLPPAPEGAARMAMITERDGELFALIGDEVADVMRLPPAGFEPCPPTLASAWAGYCSGVHRLTGQLLVVLDVERILSPAGQKA